MSSFTTRLPSENTPHSYYKVKVVTSPKSFSVLIVHDRSAFKGTVDEKYVTDQSKILNINENEYIEELQNAMKVSQSSNAFTYSISGEYFNIKKQIKTSQTGVKVKFCSLKLAPADFSESVLDMLDSTLAENLEFSQKINKFQDEIKTLTERTESIVRQFESLQEAKTAMENELYRQFLNLINSKKKRIRELEQKLGGEVKDDSFSEDNKEEMHVDHEVSDGVFDADTDVDEETTEMKTEAVEVTNHENVTQVNKKWNIKDFLNSEANEKPSGSNVQNILNAMSFLDPTVPFKT